MLGVVSELSGILAFKFSKRSAQQFLLKIRTIDKSSVDELECWATANGQQTAPHLFSQYSNKSTVPTSAQIFLELRGSDNQTNNSACICRGIG